MKSNWLLSPERKLTEAEKSLIWQKPTSHIESEAERRICAEVKRNWQSNELKITNILLEGDAGSGKTQLAKALSANFGLPYTKVTCFADMDKSDIIGSILPVLSQESGQQVGYQFYPSEIVRAYEHGWLLEIQEPTVIRDAAVLMALNSALEPDGSINLPTRILRRHPDFIAVITTNRGYNGCRPLNEALRDRVQHSEKMDLPPKAVMMERASVKTGCTDEHLLSLLADVILTLDDTAKANAIKGVAGMRSYLFWVDAVASGASLQGSIYHKVLYKITTDPAELAILEQALKAKGLNVMIQQADLDRTKPAPLNEEVMELHLAQSGGSLNDDDSPADPRAVRLRKSADSEGHSEQSAQQSTQTQSSDSGEDGAPIYHHRVSQDHPISSEQKQAFRKQLNHEARSYTKGSLHQGIKLVVHRPKVGEEHREAYRQYASVLMPIIRELTRKTSPLLVHESSEGFASAKLYGSRFDAGRVASQDLRTFSRKLPPQHNPSLAVALRIDESASMAAFGRLDAAKQAAVALYEFCSSCGIPVMIYGDTADRSPAEQMSLYAYVDFKSKDPDDPYSLMSIEGRSNNRDGMALRILSEQLLKAPQQTKLLISLSDGQPKALPDYTGELAADDMKKTLQDYRRKGIIFLAAAIGQDKDTISELYGSEHTLDISDLRQLPARLVQIIARYL